MTHHPDVLIKSVTNYEGRTTQVLSVIFLYIYYTMDRDSSVGIATGYGNRIPVRARFFAHVQTGSGAHPASCTMGSGSFPGVNRPGRDADHPPLLALRSRECRPIPLPPSGLSSLLRGNFIFTFITLLHVSAKLGAHHHTDAVNIRKCSI
jgi:hypothetical protein